SVTDRSSDRCTFGNQVSSRNRASHYEERNEVLFSVLCPLRVGMGERASCPLYHPRRPSCLPLLEYANRGAGRWEESGLRGGRSRGSRPTLSDREQCSPGSRADRQLLPPPDPRQPLVGVDHLRNAASATASNRGACRSKYCCQRRESHSSRWSRS